MLLFKAIAEAQRSKKIGFVSGGQQSTNLPLDEDFKVFSSAISVASAPLRLHWGNPARVGSLMVVAMVLLAGCAGSRPEVIDALTGQPVEAQIRSLDGGRLLVSANGYEMRVAQPGELVELVPLWQERFMNAAEPRESVKPREARPCCPGQTTR